MVTCIQLEIDGARVVEHGGLDQLNRRPLDSWRPHCGTDDEVFWSAFNRRDRHLGKTRDRYCGQADIGADIDVSAGAETCEEFEQ
jgi:hypothetical protein